jgi:hypothetical protein
MQGDIGQGDRGTRDTPCSEGPCALSETKSRRGGRPMIRSKKRKWKTAIMR